MQRKVVLVAAAMVLALIVAVPAHAITFGQPDGNRHPNVGALVAEYIEPGQKDILCTGTLIAPTVFLTASHCTTYLTSIGIAPDEVWVTFDPRPDQGSEYIGGTYYSHPLFGHDQANPYDIAVVVLDTAPGIQPAQLPPAGYLETLKRQGTLDDQWFTAVGYGTERTSKTGGPHAFVFNGERRYVTQEFLSLTTSWITYSENISTGNGGTCYGDSGGPHFLADTPLIVSITIVGDAQCRATDKTYRIDTPWAREFLGQFVPLP
jgi:secreted trypsin-like serine protease